MLFLRTYTCPLYTLCIYMLYTLCISFASLCIPLISCCCCIPFACACCSCIPFVDPLHTLYRPFIDPLYTHCIPFAYIPFGIHTLCIPFVHSLHAYPLHKHSERFIIMNLFFKFCAWLKMTRLSLVCVPDIIKSLFFPFDVFLTPQMLLILLQIGAKVEMNCEKEPKWSWNAKKNRSQI